MEGWGWTGKEVRVRMVEWGGVGEEDGQVRIDGWGGTGEDRWMRRGGWGGTDEKRRERRDRLWRREGMGKEGLKLIHHSVLFQCKMVSYLSVFFTVVTSSCNWECSSSICCSKQKSIEPINNDFCETLHFMDFEMSVNTSFLSFVISIPSPEHSYCEIS